MQANEIKKLILLEGGRSKIDLFNSIVAIQFDNIFLNNGYVIPEFKIKLNQFGPDFTKPESLNYLEKLLNSNLDFKGELTHNLNIESILNMDRSTFGIIIQRLRNLKFRNPKHNKIAKDYLNNPYLPRNQTKYAEVEFAYKKQSVSTVNLEAKIININKINSTLSCILNKNDSLLELSFVYPELTQFGLGGFGDHFILILFKSILNSKYITQLIIPNPTSQYWNRFSIDNPLSSFKTSLTNSKFSTKENTLSKTEIKLWLYTREYLAKSALSQNDLQNEIDPNKIMITDLEKWLIKNSIL